MRLEVSPRARELLERLSREHREPCVLLDDTTCCTVSNVLVREGAPPWEACDAGELYGVRFFLHPTLIKSLGPQRSLLIDLRDSADDSLSLETNYGKRLVMLLAESKS